MSPPPWHRRCVGHGTLYPKGSECLACVAPIQRHTHTAAGATPKVLAPCQPGTEGTETPSDLPV